MSYRGWHESESHWLEDFCCGFLGGMTGFFNFPGWLFICFDWLNVSTTLLVCAGIELLFGVWLAYKNIRDKRNAAASQFAVTSTRITSE